MVYFHPTIYYVRYSILLRCYRIMLFGKPVNFKLITISVFFTLLFFVQQLINLFFRLLDEILYFKYRAVNIKEPVYIIANPRSGTTYLHRLVSLDDNRFAYMKFLHTLFPSVSFIKLTHLISKIDKKAGGHVTRLLDKAAEKLFSGWDEIHNMGFNKAEEDEAPFALSLTSVGVFLLFPYLHLFKDTWILDNESESVKKDLMLYYSNCIKRFMYASGKNKTYLSKNVLMSGRLQTMLEYFPDARIIYIVRNPYQVLPSFVSMFAVMYRVHSKRLNDNDPAMQAWAEAGMAFYLNFYKFRNHIQPGNLVTLKYNDFIKAPVETVEHIYNHFGLAISELLKDKLTAAVYENRHFKSKHAYSLEQYGLSKNDIAEKLKVIFDEFGFEAPSE